MARNWLRTLRLDVSGTRIELSGETDDPGLRVRFEIKDRTIQSPRIASIRITNLSRETAQKIKNEGTTVELLAGYRSQMGRIFQGEIKQKRIGRENPTDTYVDIFAASQERAYNNAVVNTTLKAGSSGEDVYKACLETMKPFGIQAGQIPDILKTLKFPRPYTLFGMTREALRTLAMSSGCTWNVRENNKLDVIPKDGALEGGAIVLTSRTGLVGMPTQTEMGIIARCLINTRIGINTTVKIDQKSIQEAAQNLSYGGEPFNTEPYLPSLAADGLYRVVGLDHVGDTHGQPWYCELYLISRSGAGPTKSQISLGWN